MVLFHICLKTAKTILLANINSFSVRMFGLRNIRLKSIGTYII